MISLESYKNRINETLESLIPLHSPFSPSLYEGGRYALLAPGKRIRPLLTLCTVEMLNEREVEAAVIPACALEMIHTYSLIHDDLPCMDDDDFRRGLPTLHRVYTEAHAVLMGDYLLTFAFETLAKSPLLTPEQQISLIRSLASASGGEGMIGGQIMDIEGSSQVDEMHAKKTGALFVAALEFGGIIAQANSEVLELLRTFGLQFGKLFQMVDDLLDGDHPLGREKAEESAQVYFHSCVQTLASLPGNPTILQTIIETVYSAIAAPQLL